MGEGIKVPIETHDCELFYEAVNSFAEDGFDRIVCRCSFCGQVKHQLSKREVKMKFNDQCSGDNSEAFWKRINDIKNENLRDLAYSLGCDLQNYEADVLGKINTLIEADEKMGKGEEK